MSLTHIFFDLDGTLVDSSEGIHNGFVQTFERLGLPVPSDQKIRTFMGPPLEEPLKKRLAKKVLTKLSKFIVTIMRLKGNWRLTSMMA